MGRKTPTTIALTERQDQAIRREAAKNDISFGDQVRRILDGWLSQQPAATTPQRSLYGATK